MKHTILVTLVLVALFLIGQIVGLGLIAKDAQVQEDATGIVVNHPDTAMGARPQTHGSASLVYVLVGILLGTVLVLVLARFRKITIWRAWFFFAVWMSVSIALGVFVKASFPYIALLIGAALAALKMWRYNFAVHNATEILMYAGIALLIVPLFTVLWAAVLLIIIAVYDMYAVWKSKHMIVMAKFQTESKLFAGLLVHYSLDKEGKKGAASASVPEAYVGKAAQKGHVSKKAAKGVRALASARETTAKSAILGGGDMAFPLIFSGAALEWLLTQGYTKGAAFLLSNIITLFAAIALLGLFLFAKKDRFYPAMPFLAAGCFVGFGVLWLLI